MVDLGIADPAGKPVNGLLILPGVEVSCREGHVLVVGATWTGNPGEAASEVVKRARDLGALAIAPHPLEHLRHGVGAATLRRVAFHAVETFNSKCIEPGANRRAATMARLLGLPAVAGSDAHASGTVGRAHTLILAEELSTQHVLDAIRCGRTEVVGGLHSPREMAAYFAAGTRALGRRAIRAATRVGGTVRRRVGRRFGGLASVGRSLPSEHVEPVTL